MRGRGLKMISVKIPVEYYEAVRLLVERGVYATLSEAVRAGLALLIRRDAELAALVAIIREQERLLREKEKVLDAVRHRGVET